MTWKVVFAALLGLLFGLVTQAPINKILPRVIPDSAGIALYELDGTLLEGRAGYVSAQGIGADDLSWVLHPATLLLGRVSADVEVSMHSRNIEKDNAWLTASVSRSLFGNTIVARDVQAAAPLSALQKPLKLPYLPVDAVIRLNLEHARVVDMAPQQVQGQAYLTQTLWKLGQPVGLGDYRVDLSTPEGKVVATLTDSEAAKVGIQGQAEVSPDRAYSVDIQLKPKLETPESVANQMKALGRTDAQGWYRIRQDGKF